LSTKFQFEGVCIVILGFGRLFSHGEVRSQYLKYSISNAVRPVSDQPSRADGLRPSNGSNHREGFLSGSLLPDVLSARTPQAIHFGQYTYRHILLDMPPAAKLTPEQTTVLTVIESMAKATDLSQLSAFSDILKSSEYKHVVNIVHKVRLSPEDPIRITMRDRFHTPWTDFIQSLWQTTAPDNRVEVIKRAINHLTGVVSKAQDVETRRNGIEALADVYFYNLRPKGSLSDLLKNKLVRTKNDEKDLRALREAGLAAIRQVLLGHPEDTSMERLKTRRELRNELVFALRDISKFKQPQAKRLVRKVIQPFSKALLPLYQPIPLSPESVQKLKTAIQLGDLTTLKAMIASGEMKALIPEWERVGGPDNHQHIVQDYNLADHLLNTLKATQNSVYYRMLNPEEQFTVSTAAFFHDLRKRTGPPNLREAARICVDPHHPGRSAESVLEYLPSLGYTPKQVQDVYTLIEHHQLLGNMARPDAVPTTPTIVRQAASALGSSSVLKMLRALTEGDVRCVRFDVPDRTWYDPDMIQRVYEYSQRVLEVLIQKEQKRPIL
jgi:hypothetical protein